MLDSFHWKSIGDREIHVEPFCQWEGRTGTLVQ